jgi:hypothetical protein
MNKHLATFTLALLAVIAFFVVLGWVGDMDYTEQCILRMSYEEYDTIKDSLTTRYGHEPSEREIANHWADHNR